MWPIIFYFFLFASQVCVLITLGDNTILGRELQKLFNFSKPWILISYKKKKEKRYLCLIAVGFCSSYL